MSKKVVQGCSENLFLTAVRLPTLKWVGIAFSPKGLCRLAFAHPTREAAIGALGAGLRNVDCRGRELAERLEHLLREYASGRCVDFGEIPVDLGRQTSFQEAVAACCRKIPYGETRTYRHIAEQVGSAGAARAVGNQMARNPVPIVVPCHRVVGAGGHLGGYSAPGGVEMKRRLLRLEGVLPSH